MTLTQFKKDAGIPTRQKDFIGMDYQSIHRLFTSNAQAGREQGFLSDKQHDALLEQRDRVLHRLTF